MATPVHTLGKNTSFPETVNRPVSTSNSRAGGEFSKLLSSVRAANPKAPQSISPQDVVSLARIALMKAALNGKEQHNLTDFSSFFPGLSKQEAHKYSPAVVQQRYASYQPEKKEVTVAGLAHSAGTRYDVDPKLVKAVIRAESDSNHYAVSSAGAQGLMQLMPETARDLGVQNPFDPEENVMGGTRHLKRLLDKYAGDLDRALAAYNWGEGNVDRKGMGRLPGETRQYIARIKGFLQDTAKDVSKG